jgi:ABC-type Zn uptake system ZnuABC Zn-binding protein ZnuA
MAGRPVGRTVVALCAVVAGAALGASLLAGCREGSAGGGPLRVVASTSFLADIAQNVAGRVFTVERLIPLNADPHAFEPTPADIQKVSESDLLILNGAGLEGTLEQTLRNAGGHVKMVIASAGIQPRTPKPGEPAAEHDGEADPHFWLDPVLVIGYVENIRDAFAKADPAHAAEYRANAAKYIRTLRDLDAWIRRQVALIPLANRRLVMNHASHGYFADRYGFLIVGAVIPSVSTGSSPTARQLADLTAVIERAKVRAVFVEIDENPKLAEQIAREAGVQVVTGLRDHSLTGRGGVASTYVAMMQYDTRLIVEALR